MKDTQTPRVSTPDDIDNLIRHMANTKLQYIDISGDQTRARAHQRWPLLAELSEHASRTCGLDSTAPPSGYLISEK